MFLKPFQPEFASFCPEISFKNRGSLKHGSLLMKDHTRTLHDMR